MVMGIVITVIPTRIKIKKKKVYVGLRRVLHILYSKPKYNYEN